MEFNPLAIILAAAGVLLLIKLRFFFILHPIKTAVRGLRGLRNRRARRSFALALAGTLGVGNVFGVAIGIMVGGAGSLFWLFISMFFAMVIKYSEVVLTGDNLYHDTDSHGGIYYVIRSSFGRGAETLSRIYAFSILLLSLVMGASLQTDAIVESVAGAVDLSPLPVAILLVTLVTFAIFGNVAKIEKITAFVIPLTTIIYIILAFSVIAVNFDKLPETLICIISSAFSYRGALGGAVGFLFSSPVREGFARGILSNEAGAGTSSIAHARSGVLSPVTAGILGIFEVWFDTGLICMLTGLSILLSVPEPTAFEDGMSLVFCSVADLFGTTGKYIILFCVFAFAFATVVCWYYYGSEAFRTLFGKRKRAVFLPLFLVFVFYGCFADTMLLVSATDLLMLLATLITVATLIKSSDRIRELSELGGVVDSESGRLRRLRIKNIREILSLKGNRHR